MFVAEYAGQYPQDVGANEGVPGAREMEGDAVGVSTELPE